VLFAACPASLVAVGCALLGHNVLGAHLCAEARSLLPQGAMLT
jgi:hypothetical protein